MVSITCVYKRTKPHAIDFKAHSQALIARARDVGLLKMLPADPVGRYNEVFDEKTPPQGSLKEKGSTGMWAGVLGWVSTSSSRRGYILSGDSVLEVSLISN